MLEASPRRSRGTTQHRNQQQRTTAFVTFATNHHKNIVLDYNPDTIAAKVRQFIPCLHSQHKFTITKGDITYNDLRILPAPDPEDIVWANIGVKRT